MDHAGYAGVVELRALVGVFGLCGARELAARSERPLEVAVASLGESLATHAPLLMHLADKSQVRQPAPPASPLWERILWGGSCVGWCVDLCIML